MNDIDNWDVGVETPDGMEVFAVIGVPSFQDKWCMFMAEMDGERRRITATFPRERVIYVERRFT